MFKRRLLLGTLILMLTGTCNFVLADPVTITNFDGDGPARPGVFQGRNSIGSWTTTTGKVGNAVQFDYEHKPRGWVGFFLDFKSSPVNARGMKTLRLWVKGRSGGETVRIGLKDARMGEDDDAILAGNISDYLQSKKVTTEWQEATVPLSDFPSLDLSQVASIVFQRIEFGEGTLFFDEVVFSLVNGEDDSTTIIDFDNLRLIDKMFSFVRAPSTVDPNPNFPLPPAPNGRNDTNCLSFSYVKKPASWAGAWVSFNKPLDFSKTQQLSLYVKGTGIVDFTVGLNNKKVGNLSELDTYARQTVSRYLGKPISEKWQKVTIPISEFRVTEGNLVDLSKVQKISFTVAYQMPPSQGTVFIDDITFGEEPPTTSSSLWVWDAEVITNFDKRKKFFDFCAQKNITLIYQEVGNAFIEKDESQKVQVSQQELADFINQAHAKGIKVHALDGDASWAYSQNHEIALGRLQRALEFNQSVQANKRLDGFQFDIEPYLLKEFRLKGTKWQGVLVQYLDLVSQMRDAVQDTDRSFELGYAIPFWWDVQNTSVSQVTWKNVSKPVAYHLIDLLNTLPKAYIAIMAYRDFTEGPDGSIRHSTDEIEYVDEHAENVTVFVGQETGDVPLPEPPKITFWQEGEAALEKAIAQLHDAFKSYKCFGRVAIHHYDAYRNLKVGEPQEQQPELKKEQPPEVKKEQLPTSKKFAILSPKKGETVNRFTTVSGTGQAGYKVTLSVYPYGDVWYSQQGEAVISTDGTWDLSCNIGNAMTRPGHKFKIRAFLKDKNDKEISTIVLDYVKR